MAKKQALKVAEPEPEELPDDEPEQSVEDEGGDHNKSELIREAVRAGYDKPVKGVEYIKKQHGVDINTKYFSIVKSKLGKSGNRATNSLSPPPQPAAQPASNGSVPASLFDDLKQLRQMKDRYGDDFEKMVEAIG